MATDSIVKTVILASEFKSFLMNNITDVEISTDLKSHVIDCDDNALLEVTKSIGSLKIVDIRIIDNDFVNAVLGSKG